MVKNVLEKLEEYESHLHLLEIKENLTECLSTNDISKIHKIINNLLS